MMTQRIVEIAGLIACTGRPPNYFNVLETTSERVNSFLAASVTTVIENVNTEVGIVDSCAGGGTGFVEVIAGCVKNGDRNFTMASHPEFCRYRPQACGYREQHHRHVVQPV